MCVYVCTNIHKISVYTYALAYMALFAKMVAEEDRYTFFLLKTIGLEGEDNNLSGKKTSIFCTITLCNVWWNTDNSMDIGNLTFGF